METAMELMLVESTLPIQTDHKKRQGKKEQMSRKKKAKTASIVEEPVTNPTMDHDDLGVDASMFDYSVENHLRAIDTIAGLCGEFEGDAAFEKTDVERFSSNVIFLREWRHFNYKPRTMRFACETGCAQGKKIVSEMDIPQFSAATVPKEILSGDTPPGSSKDFVIYVGGPIWALDWCPRVDHHSNHHINCEFIAVSAHPPGSSYHKIGAPLTGRGMVQIWCLLHVAAEEEEVPLPVKGRGSPKSISTQPKRPRGRPKSIISTQPKRPRGRPRKIPIDENDMVCQHQLVQALAVEHPKDSSEKHDEVSLSAVEHTAQKDSCESRKGCGQGVSAGKSSHATSVKGVKNKTEVGSCRDDISIPLLTQNRDQEASAMNSESNHSCGQDLLASTQKVPDNLSLELNPTGNSIPKDLVLPRVVLCLAHNGKVAWDVKWQPCNVHNSACKIRMGYLAVLLGNGSLEVWEVPSPHIMKLLYSHSEEGIDPRFLKLEPVFRCSKLQCGDRQSIPLALEWSASPPHDLILVGSHDGTVALWKFSASDSCKDTRPLLCFPADTAPIRALAWAPVENDPEAANLIITAGHEGFKFWDLRDPYRPLWDLKSGRRVVYSLDWLPNPRCVILALDDGTLRILSLLNAALDVHVTGKPFVGTQCQGYHSYYCSSFSIWSVQASRTGMVAYCNADGTALNFQLTTKAVEKDPFRNRAPHFLCGSLTEEESVLTVNTPVPDTPFPMKMSDKEWGNAPRSIRGFVYQSNQAKRANELKAQGQNPDDEILALCYGDEAGTEFELEDALASSKSKQTPKSKNSKNVAKDDQALAASSNSKRTPNSKKSSKKVANDDLALVNMDERPDAMMELKGIGQGEVGNEVEALPPKVVAMHRVRWNMNKGSGRWLCYGGAAGILRCQEISTSNVNKKSLPGGNNGH